MNSPPRNPPYPLDFPNWLWVAILPVALLLVGVVSRGREISPLVRPLIDAEGRWLVVLVGVITLVAMASTIFIAARPPIRAVAAGLLAAGGGMTMITLPGWQAVLTLAVVATFAASTFEFVAGTAPRRIDAPATSAWLSLAGATAIALLPLIALSRYRFTLLPFALLAALIGIATTVTILSTLDVTALDLLLATSAVAGLLLAQAAWVALHVDLGYIQLGIILAMVAGAISSTLTARAQPEPSFRPALEPALVACAVAFILLIDPF